MPQCANGSEPKPTSSAFFTFTESDLASFAAPIFGFVTYGLMGIPTLPQSVSDFCAAEPAGDLPTAADYAKLAFPPLALLSGSYARFGNQVKLDKFAALCQCRAAPGGTSCTSTWDASHVFTDFGAAGSNFEVGTKFTSLVAQSLTSIRYWRPSSGSANISVTLWDGNGTHLYGEALTGLAVGSNDITLATPQALLASHDYVLSFCLGTGFPNVADGTNTPPSDAFVTYVSHTFNSGCGVFPSSASGGWPPIQPLICSGGSSSFNPPPALTPPSGWPSSPAAPTCSTTQDVCNTLQTITAKLLNVETMVNLIQRQHVPFGYILGTPSTGLTGNGILAASGIIGAVVTLTTIPATWGKTADIPSRSIPKYGEVSFATADGLLEPNPLHYQSELVMTMGFTTSINYTLRPGIVATITPIQREA